MSEPKVRLLEWYPDPGSFPCPTWGAQSSFGRFLIEEVGASDTPAYEVRYTPHHLIAIKDSLEEAKEAGQADYEKRIRSALTIPPPSPDVDRQIAETVVQWMVRQGFLDADNEYQASDIAAVLADLEAK